MGVKSPNGSLGEIFGTGDLLLLGALLLLNVSTDIRMEDAGEPRIWMALHEVFFFVLAIGAIVVYGPLRFRSLELLRLDGEESLVVLHAVATFSWLYTGYAAIHTVTVKAILLRAKGSRIQHGQ